MPISLTNFTYVIVKLTYANVEAARLIVVTTSPKQKQFIGQNILHMHPDGQTHGLDIQN